MDLGEIKRANLIEYTQERWGLECNRGAMALCPFHDDRFPSLHIYRGKGGSWHFKCHGCGKSGSIIDLKMFYEGLSQKEACVELSKEFQGPIEKVDPKILAATAKKRGGPGILAPAAKKEGVPSAKKGTGPQEEKKAKHTFDYDYKDEAGKVLYRKVKEVYEDGEKKYRFKHHPPGKPDLWDWTKGKAEFIPYNLDKFKGNTEVIICEGEKDADTISRLKIGILATSAPAGKGAWPDPLTPYFKDLKNVSFIYDVGAEKDARGHAEKLQTAHPKMEIFIVKIPMEKKGQDITDYLAALKTQKEKQIALSDLLIKGEKFTIEQPEEIRAHIIHMDKISLRPIEWLWDQVFPLAKVSLLVGDAGAGKSYFTTYMASRITTGRGFVDPEEKQPIGNVVIITTEDDVHDTIKLRTTLMGADDTKLKVIPGVILNNEISALALSKHLAIIGKAVEEIGGARLLVWDPITEFMDIKDDNRAGPTRAALAPLQTFAEKFKTSVLLLSHMNKNEATRIIYRTTGSQSYVNLPRSVWSIGKDPAKKERRFFLQIKQNLTYEQPGFAFSLTAEKGIIFEKKRVKIVDGEVFGTEEQKFERSAVEEAMNFLLETLVDGSVPASEIIKAAAQNSIAPRTLTRAKLTLKIISYRELKGDKVVWFWKIKKATL